MSTGSLSSQHTRHSETLANVHVQGAPSALTAPTSLPALLEEEALASPWDKGRWHWPAHSSLLSHSLPPPAPALVLICSERAQPRPGSPVGPSPALGHGHPPGHVVAQLLGAKPPTPGGPARSRSPGWAWTGAVTAPQGCVDDAPSQHPPGEDGEDTCPLRGDANEQETPALPLRDALLLGSL